MTINSRIVGMRRTGELRMKEYEVMKEIINACGGSRGADRSIEEIEVNSLQEYIQKKHPTDYQNAKSEHLENGDVIITLQGTDITYRYVFTEI